VVGTVDDCPPIVAMARLDASSDLIHLLVVASSPLLARDALTASWEVLSNVVVSRDLPYCYSLAASSLSRAVLTSLTSLDVILALLSAFMAAILSGSIAMSLS